MAWHFPTAIFLTLAFTACKPKNNAETSPHGRSKPACGLGWVKNQHPDSVKSDPFELLSANMNGRCLDLSVRYGGGCGEANFQLIWDGSLRESLPEQASLRLILDDQDHCRALLTKTISFEISTINPGKTTQFFINDLPEPVLFDPKAGD